METYTKEKKETSWVSHFKLLCSFFQQSLDLHHPMHALYPWWPWLEFRTPVGRYLSTHFLKSKLGLLPVWSQRRKGGGLKQLNAFLRESGLNLARPKRLWYFCLGRKILSPLSATVGGLCGNRCLFFLTRTPKGGLCVCKPLKTWIRQVFNLTLTNTTVLIMFVDSLLLWVL